MASDLEEEALMTRALPDAEPHSNGEAPRVPFLHESPILTALEGRQAWEGLDGWGQGGETWAS